MASTGTDKLFGQEWSAIAFQSAVVIGGVMLIDREKGNAFVSLALLLVLSLFCLQAVSRRFLMFYPVNGFHGVPTDSADTVILKVFSILAVSSLVIGYVNPQSEFFVRIHGYVLASFYVLGPLLVAILPLFWLAKGKQFIRDRVVQKLIDEPLVLTRECLWRPGESKSDEVPRKPHSCTVTYRVVSENLIETVTECEICDFKVHHQEKVPIGA
jgi:hypothetical protein